MTENENQPLAERQYLLSQEQLQLDKKRLELEQSESRKSRLATVSATVLSFGAAFIASAVALAIAGQSNRSAANDSEAARAQNQNIAAANLLQAHNQFLTTQRRNSYRLFVAAARAERVTLDSAQRGVIRGQALPGTNTTRSWSKVVADSYEPLVAASVDVQLVGSDKAANSSKDIAGRLYYLERMALALPRSSDVSHRFLPPVNRSRAGSGTFFFVGPDRQVSDPVWRKEWRRQTKQLQKRTDAFVTLAHQELLTDETKLADEAK